MVADRTARVRQSALQHERSVMSVDRRAGPDQQPTLDEPLELSASNFHAALLRADRTSSWSLSSEIAPASITAPTFCFVSRVCMHCHFIGSLEWHLVPPGKEFRHVC